MDSAEASTPQEQRLKGIAVSPGVVMGPLVVINHEEVRVPSHTITEEDIPSEVARLEAALVETREQITRIQQHLASSIGEKDASIFDAHLLVVEDSSLVEAVKKQMAIKKRCVETTYQHLMMAYAKSMRELDDPYLQERAADIIDVGKRVVNNLMGRKLVDPYQLERPSIILAHDLSPSDTALLDRNKVLGFATEAGSPTSHSAIMARSLNIPAVVGLKGACTQLAAMDEVLLDGHEGLLILHPSDQTKFEYGQIEQRRHEVTEKLGQLRETQGRTADNRRIIIAANVELPEDLPLLTESGAEGIGLYRTEFLFLNRVDIPSEEEQMQDYRRVIQFTGEHGSILRTLDLGGDKMPHNVNLGEDMNPFLGWRAIRYCLSEPDVFRTQLRAMTRAAAGSKLKIMFPMIATPYELFEAKRHLYEVIEELKSQNIEHCESIELGMMVEIPSAAITIDQFVDHVDFFSIGTNDLIGYTLAVDRTNERVAYLYQPTNPAVIRLIRNVVEAAHSKNRWVGICGETAGDIHLTPLLVGLGVDELSMGSISIPRVKKAVQSLSYDEMKGYIDEFCHYSDAAKIDERLHEICMRCYPDLML